MSNLSAFMVHFGVEPPTAEDLVGAAKHAEELGFYSFSIPQVPILGRGGRAQDMPWSLMSPENLDRHLDPIVLIPMIGQATSRIRFGLNIAIIALEHPYFWAKYMASLDAISGGRFLSIFGGGWQADVVDGKPYHRGLQSFGIDARKRGAMADESLALIKRLWTEDGLVSHEGDHYHAFELNINPKAARKPYPELWWASAPKQQSKPSLRRAAQYGDGLELIWPPLSEVRDFWVPSLEKANARYGGHAKPTMILYGDVRPEGDLSPDQLKREYPHYAEVPFESGETGSIAVGSAERCAQTLRDLHEAGVDHFVLDFNRHGAQNTKAFRETMERFAKEVAPLLK